MIDFNDIYNKDIVWDFSNQYVSWGCIPSNSLFIYYTFTSLRYSELNKKEVLWKDVDGNWFRYRCYSGVWFPWIKNDMDD